MIDAAIFDMDGLLLESESLWRVAEREAAAWLDLPLTDDDFDRTMGVRMRDVARIWFEWHPWEGPSTDEVADRVIERVMDLARSAPALPGVESTLAAVAGAGLRVGLCSSSDARMIESIIDGLGIRDRFEVVHSAEDDEFGKPHPQPYLVTAHLLGVPVERCVVFEDSVVGAVAARSAGMRVIAVPGEASRGSGDFGFCNRVLRSLDEFEIGMLDDLDVPAPSMSRPRFHLALPVDDLVAARHFYGEVLECGEGRSADTWVDWDLHGHQVVTHLDPGPRPHVATNPVDGHDVPASHFGLILTVEAWRRVVERLQAAAVPFIMEPTVRFAGEPGEQHTCFVLDPSGNALEFKAFKDDRQVFATNL